MPPPATFEDNTQRVIRDLHGVSFTRDDGASLASVSAVKAGLVPDAMQKSVSRFMDRPHILRLAVESASRRAAFLVEKGTATESVPYVNTHMNAMLYLLDRVRYREIDADAADNWLTWYALERYLSAKICEAGLLFTELSQRSMLV